MSLHRGSSRFNRARDEYPTERPRPQQSEALPAGAIHERLRALEARVEQVREAVGEVAEALRQIKQVDDPEQRLLTKADAAERLNVSPRLVDTLIAAGDLPSVKVRRCRRIPPAALDAYIRRQAEEGRSRG